MAAALPDRRGGAVDAVLHAENPGASATPASGPPSRSCARCGTPVPTGPSGRPRPYSRFCSTACRMAEVRDRRATARAELLAALDQLGKVTQRVEVALKVLGLNPSRRRPPSGPPTAAPGEIPPHTAAPLSKIPRHGAGSGGQTGEIEILLGAAQGGPGAAGDEGAA